MCGIRSLFFVSKDFHERNDFAEGMPRLSKRRQHIHRVWTKRKCLESTTEASQVIPSPAWSEEGELTNEGNMTLNEPSMNDNGDHSGEEEGISTPLPDQDENVTDETTTDSDEDFVESTQDTSSMMLSYSQDWVVSLLRDDQKSLSILLHSLLVDKLQMQKSVASETVGQIIGVSERTVREWRSVFTENDGCFPDSLQGKYV